MKILVCLGLNDTDSERKSNMAHWSEKNIIDIGLRLVGVYFKAISIGLC
jgi:hypothetical protein